MEYTRYIGWDVHAATIAVAVAETVRRPAHFEGTLPGQGARRAPVGVQRQPDHAARVLWDGSDWVYSGPQKQDY